MKEYRALILVCSFLALTALIPVQVRAHCDTLDGPVVASAKEALEKGDIRPVLKWVKGNDEKEVKEVFQKVLIARKTSPEAREIADKYFFETLVRIHRAGEGAPYTGLQAGPAEPIILEADKSLEAGSIEAITKHVTATVTNGIKKRFSETLERKKHANESVAAGREFVEAYVDYTHYLERLYNDAVGQAPIHAKPNESKANGGPAH
ncbi:MAG: hypothetical protein KA801_14295 [Syntrophorhabdaceae bacterium]|nr:hypothetical protein [Syntrophorhabdaceae bacterium]